jgi:DNA-binding transcriptional regulator YiaG
MSEQTTPISETARKNLEFLRSGQPLPSEKVFTAAGVLVEERRNGVTTWMLADAPETLPESVVTLESVDTAALRRHFRQTQEGMAALLGISVQTWRNWEAERRAPRGPALNLLKVAAASPSALLDADLQPA